MATSRNLALRLAQDKYCFEWILFVEDDLLYTDNWYPELIKFARENYGTKSPLDLFYGVFSASPSGAKNDESCQYDEQVDAYASLFGLRADQRLYKYSNYINVAKEWSSDLLGISSCRRYC